MNRHGDVKYDPIVRIKWVAGYLGVNVTTIWRWRNNSQLGFPEPMCLGKKIRGWRRSKIEHWIENRPLEID